MIKQRPTSYYFYFRTRKRAMVTCTVPLETPPTPNSPNDHNSLRLSLADDLLRRGRVSLAQQVIQRIIAHSPTVPDAISAVDFAAGRGMELGVGIYGVFIRRLIELGQSKLAYAVYCDNVIAKGIDPDSSIINSMVICLVKLGKLEDASILFDKLIGSGFVPCHAACMAVIREFCVQEMLLDAFDCLVSISKAKIQLGMRYYNFLIDGLSYKGHVREAMKVLDIMHERTGLLPTLHNYKSLFYGLCKKGWVVEAESIGGEMEERGFFLDKIMYTSLMNAYLKDKKIKMAVMVFLRMLKMGCEPDTFTYTALIQGIVKMGYFNKGWILYSQMNESRMLPDAVTYHILISNYCKEGKIICATTLLNNMACCNLIPSVHSYTALMSALYKDNRLTEVDELYKSMLNHGVIPDHVLFLILMKNSKRGNELQLSLLMLQDILKHGCGLNPTLLSGSTNIDPMINLEQEIEFLLEKIIGSNLNLANVAFGIYITALCERGNLDAALSCLRKMIDVGCSPLPFTFNSLVKCICQDGCLESFEPLVDIMQEWSIVPDLATYLIMINEYCKNKDLTSAFHVLDQMEERGLKPSVSIYNSILSCLSRKKRMSEAETLFQRMLEAGVDLDATVYMTMINGYFKNGQALEAHQLFEKMIKHDIQPCSYTYTVLISGLVKSNMAGKGCKYLDRMLGDGFVPNVVLHTSLIYHFLRKGEFDFAFRLVDLMDRSQIEPDVVFYIALVSGVSRYIDGVKKRCKINRKSDREREMLLHLLFQRKFLPRETILRFSFDSSEHIKCFVLKLMHRIKETKFMPNLSLYNSIISGLCWANRIEDAYNQFELMQKEGICPNEVTFTILIEAHSRAGQINQAIELFNLMNADGYKLDKVAYNTLLRGLCKAGKELHALSLVFAMRKRGFFPNKASYETLLRCFCACYLSIPAFNIVEEMFAHNYVPRRYSANWLLCILCKEKKLNEAHKLLDMMHKRAIHISVTEWPVICYFQDAFGFLEDADMQKRSDLHTKRTGHTEFVDKTSEAAKAITLEVPKPPMDVEEPADVSTTNQPEGTIFNVMQKQLKWLLQRLTKSSSRNWKEWVSPRHGQLGHFVILASGVKAAVNWIVELRMTQT